MPSLLLVFMLLLCGLIASSAVITLMAWGILHPPRMTDGKAIAVLKRLSPGDLGLPFEPVTFPIRDEQGRALDLAAWWIPAPSSGPESSRCAVLLHGYADAKVGAIAWAPLFHDAGLNVLALDLRAHGESEGGRATAGYFERHDLAQALRQLRTTRPAQTHQLTLFGASSGGAVALAAAADAVADIAAIILDSPYATYTHTVMANFDRLGLPGRSFQSLALRLAAAVARADFQAVAPTSLLPRVSVPILMILPDSDPLVSDEDRACLQRALGHRANPADHLWLVPHCLHLLALQNDPGEYDRRVRGFLDKVAADSSARVNIQHVGNH